MAIYEVVAARTEHITFAIEAESPEDAEERYLMDGDETYAKTISIETIAVGLVSS